MPTPDSELDAATAEFEKAAVALAAAQAKVTEGKSPVTVRALTAAQDAYVAAGQRVRRAKDPERALDLLEFNRHLSEKAKLKARKAKASANG